MSVPGLYLSSMKVDFSSRRTHHIFIAGKADIQCSTLAVTGMRAAELGRIRGIDWKAILHVTRDNEERLNGERRAPALDYILQWHVGVWMLGVLGRSNVYKCVSVVSLGV